ncbi:MAG: hypothetical protein IPK62_12490 [Bacteroidetes bacterium]|nr:hypothetical protein [Bacteroidota bacterium]
MKIDIVAATPFELEALKRCHYNTHEVTFHVHGIGMMAALFHLQKIAEKKPNLMIQCGLAGTFSPEIEIGKSVLVAEEITDVGVEDDQQLLDLFDLNFIGINEAPYQNGVLPCPFLSSIDTDLQQVKGLTVNCTSGSASTIAKESKNLAPLSKPWKGPLYIM